jgi:hypothetical protein
MDETRTGAVTLIQRADSAPNLDIHFQMQFLDGMRITGYRVARGRSVTGLAIEVVHTEEYQADQAGNTVDRRQDEGEPLMFDWVKGRGEHLAGETERMLQRRIKQQLEQHQKRGNGQPSEQDASLACADILDDRRGKGLVCEIFFRRSEK